MSLLSRTRDLFRRTGSQKASLKKADRAAQKTGGLEGAASRERKVKEMHVATKIGLAPLTTEKGMVVAAPASAAVFRVRARATKGEIARAIQEQYGVRPLAVRTVRVRPKRRARGSTIGFTPKWKKAYVKVDDIQKLHVTP